MSDYSETVACYRSKVCQCGKAKESRHSFCGRCYHLLPVEMRRPLFGTFGEAYELAYTRAVEYLAGKLQERETA